MIWSVDPSSAEPLFAQLASQVRGAVSRGELPAGTRLPAARDLAGSLEVNVHTVLRAYQALRDDGLLELRRGRGAVVTAPAVDHSALHDDVAVLVATARRLGVPPATTLWLVKDALSTSLPTAQELR
ncbi:GntR family transcriptional regulator [Cellulomonas sp. McL0617]|uniref:GntR family transcriptional regulator n=1 Tax=Cellulomonas sp. McL0617 TaxID=3415675 RepID=UPI003CF850A1